MRFSFLSLLAALLVLSACAGTKQSKWLAGHHDALTAAANSNLSANKKLDILAENYVEMMDEALRFANPKKGVKYVQAYAKQNKVPIELILSDVKEWQSGLTDKELVAFGVKTALKPYFRQAVDLIPRFKRKYDQYALVAQLTGGLKDRLIDVILNKVGTVEAAELEALWCQEGPEYRAEAVR